MRGSILYTNHHRARLIGIVALGVAVFLLGAAIIYCLNLRGLGETSYTVSATGLEYRGEISGPVYWLNEEDGQVTVVGTFAGDSEGMQLDLRMSERLEGRDVRIKGLYWEGNPTTYVPHFQFVFDDDMRTRLEQTVERALKSSEVQTRMRIAAKEVAKELSVRLLPEIKELFNTPAIRQELIDLAIDALDERNRRRGGDPEKVPAEPAESSDHSQLYPLIFEHVSERWRALADDLAANDSVRQSFKELSMAMEEYAQEAAMHILWCEPPGLAPGTDGTPNARLVWVARRVIFGEQAPALLLVPDELAGMPLDGKGPIHCREAK